MTAKVKEPSKGGRPSSYKPEYIEQALKLARLGATDKEISDFFNVGEKTLNNWKTDHPEFLQSLKEGKLLSDAEVSSKLYHRALGYSHEDTDIRVISGEIVQTRIIKHYPPDTTACIFWLKNRQPDKWRDKTEVISDNTTVAEALKAMADKLPD
jgi:hypothetical protein